MLTLVVTGAALAFSPSVSVRPSLSRHSSLTVAPATCSHCRIAAEPSMALGGAVKWVFAAPVMYALMSVNEYATHRWYQHEEFNRDHQFQRFCQNVAAFFAKRPKLLKDGRRNMIKIKGGGHVEHHAETYDDMSLKKDERWRRTPAAASLDEDKFRGTAFTWEVTGMMTIQMLPTVLPTYLLMGFSLLQTVGILLPSMLIHALVWNMLHPPMHGLGEVEMGFGAPTKPLVPLRNTAYFKYIYENHQGHHVLGGQCNYNVCCPLTDHLLGTYVEPHVWSKRMRAVPGPDATERWGVPVEPLGVPQAPIRGVGQTTAEDLVATALIPRTSDGEPTLSPA